MERTVGSAFPVGGGGGGGGGGGAGAPATPGAGAGAGAGNAPPGGGGGGGGAPANIIGGTIKSMNFFEQLRNKGVPILSRPCRSM